MKKRILYLILAFVMLLSLAACTTQPAQEQTLPAETAAPTPAPTPEPVPETDDIVILFTNDVHCGIDANIGYAGLAAWKAEMLTHTDNVLLADCGDAVQGDLIGTVSLGEYPVELMNAVGYDYAVPGNHEFDYGMERLHDLLDMSDAQYLGCNVTYSGSRTNALESLKPYDIRSFGDTKVAFIGVLTPESIIKSTPAYFREGDEYVYDFCNESTETLYAQVQSTVDACRAEGADYVVVLSHLGDDEASVFTSVDMIAATTGIDAVLDGHAHSTIPCRVLAAADGKQVLLTSTGTKLENIGQLTISANGLITAGLISAYDGKDAEIERRIETIKASYEENVNQVVAHCGALLSIRNEDGIRIVRSRETGIGNLCADAVRAVAGADIAVVNGGGVRADLPEGDVTLADIIAVHPFGNTLCMAEVTGAQILDMLETMSRATQPTEAADGSAVGEFGGFLQVSGLRYTIDTSVEPSVEVDENGMVVAIGDARRVCEVQVLSGESWEPIDTARTYKLASSNYVIKDCGDGCTALVGAPLLIDEAMADYQVLITYIRDELNGEIGAEYAQTEGRITVR